MTPPAALHATAIVIGEMGILIRGRSGAGKSSVALALIALARQSGRFARLVADDRPRVEVAGGRLLARFHPALGGRIERRGQGIENTELEEAARIHIIVDLVAGDLARDLPPRYPPMAERKASIEGVSLIRLSLIERPSALDSALAILAFLDNPAIN